MKFVSTGGSRKEYSFEEAALVGLADDGGLLMPERLPAVDKETQARWSKLTFVQLATEFLSLFIDPQGCQGERSALADALPSIVQNSFKKFTQSEIIPLTELKPREPGTYTARPCAAARSGAPGSHQEATNQQQRLPPELPRLYMLELVHGPTLAFKDLAMQFLGELLPFLVANSEQSGASGLIILGATSGDTGSAAIAALKDKSPLIHVVILFPKSRTSAVQRLQMVTAIGPNVHCLQVDGSFDDCQKMVKEALADRELQTDLLRGTTRLPRVLGREATLTGSVGADPVQLAGGRARSWRLSVVNSINCVRIILQA
ncbi:threonine synthase, partial [Cystoisospora suis]